ncbi:putative sulfite oxidase, mitochondrial [Amphibalanus amphitrite]|uniref:sulfite oxidase n=1 Tax=Amphibalanus amphitrite TaxID=1232801 RepID=A0A6A4VG31_AMPAM|nr:putative sulfite oxidase, mitochondrial [Amphibalanus amphitrite]
MLTSLLATGGSVRHLTSAARAAPCLVRHLSSGPGGPEPEDGRGRRAARLAALAAGAALAGSALWLAQQRRGHLTAASAASSGQYGQRRADLPTFSMEEVSRHADVKERVWMTYHEGVYDVTDFVRQHPGGAAIMMGAGGSADPFWDLYAVHKEEHVLKLLERYRIGNVREDEVGSHRDGTDDPWAAEPRRHPALKPSSKTPFNAEPPPALLADNFLTPKYERGPDLFYVRNHLPVPVIDPSEYELEVDGVGVDGLTLSLEQLKNDFPAVTVTATVMCAGNRRSEMTQVKPVRGLFWGAAAVGNATWTGARLTDVLKAAGYDVNSGPGKHVCFEGLDTDPSSTPYGASIPLETAVDPRRDVILAYEMNGQPLSRDHGAPVRVIVPGVVGARNVKWLGRITVSDTESDSHWQHSDYKGFNPSVDWDTVDFSKSPAIQELPVNSAICWPAPGHTVKVKDGHVHVKGESGLTYWQTAGSVNAGIACECFGGGQRIVRVDVTADGGATWHDMALTVEEAAPAGRCWSWCLWQGRVPVPPGATAAQLWVKATDASYNTQPETFKNIWNLRGVLSNAYHRVDVNLKRV